MKNEKQVRYEEDKKYEEMILTLVLLDREMSSPGPDLQLAGFYKAKSEALFAELEVLHLQMKYMPVDDAIQIEDEMEAKLISGFKDRIRDIAEAAIKSNTASGESHPEFIKKRLTLSLEEATSTAFKQAESEARALCPDLETNIERANRLELMLKPHVIDAEKKKISGKE